MNLQHQNDYKFLLLFDLDGTLLDTARQIEICINQARFDFGYENLMPKDYLRLIGQPIDQFLMDLNLCMEEKELLIHQFRLHVRSEITNNGVKCFEGVIDFFYHLESLGISIAVATTKPTDLAKYKVFHSNLRNFKIYIQGTDNFLPKPSPFVINKILDKLKPMSALMLGDRIEDIQAAMNAVINTIGIAAGDHKEEALMFAGAKLTFPDFLGLSCFAQSDPIKFRGFFSKLV